MKKMKKATILAAVIIAMSVVSCGGGKKESEIAKVKPEKVEISGDLADYLQIVDNEYEITDDWGGNLSIKVKAIKALTEEEMKDKDFNISASLLDVFGMPVSGTGEFTMEYTSKDKLISLLKKGSGEEVIKLKAMLGDYKGEKHAEKSKKFSVSSKMTAKEKQTTSTTSTTENSDNTSATTEETATTSSSDCDQFITDYEDFVNNYIKIIKKMKANPSDMSIMTEYADMVSKAATMQTDAADCTDAKYASKLLKLASKMASAASGM